MTRRTTFFHSIPGECLVFVTLLGCGAVVRYACRDLPNFAPVAAIALVAGMYFRSALVAASLPWGIMALSDWFIGGYDSRLMAVVYGSLAFPVLLRTPLRRVAENRDEGFRAALVRGTGLFACTLAASLFFFGTTNFGCWLWGGSYESSPAGLLTCYTAALPFFRFTLLGDAIFGTLLCGSYLLVHSPQRHRELRLGREALN